MLTCWLYRRLISESLDTNRTLPRLVQCHLQNCPNCREFSDTGNRLAERLASEARREDATVPPFLHARILASLDRPDPQSVSARLGPAWVTAALVFCLVSAGAFFFIRNQRSELDHGSRAVASQNAQLAVSLLAAAAQMPTENALIEWGLKLDKPLETEMKSVVEDARTALVGMVHNFLPDESNLLR